MRGVIFDDLRQELWRNGLTRRLGCGALCLALGGRMKRKTTFDFLLSGKLRSRALLLDALSAAL